MSNKEKEIKKLIKKLNEASDAYYNGLTELMTDYEWDAAFDLLKKLEEETGLIFEDSPTNNVSADNIAGQKENHEFPALSLAKTKKVEDVVKWAEKKPIWLSWKLDGLTLVVTYDKGKLTKVVTRGDGHTGTNITHLAPAITGIPAKIKAKGHIVIRGEAVISYQDFETFCLESDEEYANPRNLASGSLTLKDINEVKKRHIQWLPFTLVYTEEKITSWGERMNWLSDNGFTPVERELIKTPTLPNLQKVIDKWTEKVTSRKNPFPVDGLVVAYDDTEYAATGSITGHHATRAGFAFKWQDESVETALDHIEWSCAASTITPVAVFEPVEIEGTTVQRASLCNISECERLGIGSKGTKLAVIKANKIIPKVIKVVASKGKFVIPHTCPVCSSPTKVNVSEQSDTKTLTCTNPECPAKQLKKFSRFVSKAGMDIDGISEQTLDRFINEGWIKEYADIYHLPEHHDEIANLEGFGTKSADNITASILKAKERPDIKVLYSLNIPLVGNDVSKKLLQNYEFNKLIETAINTDNEEVFSNIEGIGAEKSASFVKWFKIAKNKQILTNLLKEITVISTDKTPTGNKCEGKTFVITGDVHYFKNRNELKAYIESQGGKTSGAVSKNTSYLINNDITSTSGKNKKALELNIPIISEEDFRKLFC